MTEKKVDELRYYKENYKHLKNKFAHFGKFIAGNPQDEAYIKRLADIDFAIIYLLDKDAFYADKHHFCSQQLITEKLRQFRPDLSVTNEELRDSLRRSVDRKRLVVQSFINDYKVLVTKWVYNEKYVQPAEKSLSSGEQNPFESEEFMKLKEETDKFSKQ